MKGERKGQGKNPRLEYVAKVMKNMGYGTFKEVKELTWDRILGLYIL